MNLEAINRLIKSVDREVWVVTSAHGGVRGGLLANSVTSVSIVPDMPRMVIALAKHHHTWQIVESSGVLALHLLTAEQVELAWHFGTQSGKQVDKLQDVPFHVGVTGCPIVSEAKGWLECRVEERFDTGDRTLYLVQVVEGELPEPFAPLTQRQLISAATPAQLQTLRSQLATDGQLDAHAIAAWRNAR